MSITLASSGLRLVDALPYLETYLMLCCKGRIANHVLRLLSDRGQRQSADFVQLGSCSEDRSSRRSCSALADLRASFRSLRARSRIWLSARKHAGFAPTALGVLCAIFVPWRLPFLGPLDSARELVVSQAEDCPHATVSVSRSSLISSPVCAGFACTNQPRALLDGLSSHPQSSPLSDLSYRGSSNLYDEVSYV